MTIRKVSGGRYLPWYFDLQAKGRARIRRAAWPRRPVLMVINALERLKLRYCREVSFWNPLHRGKPGKYYPLDGGLQWIDFVVKPKGKGMLAIIMDDPNRRKHEYEKEYLTNKIKGLEQRGIPVLLLPWNLKTSDEYWLKIAWFIRKMKKR